MQALVTVDASSLLLAAGVPGLGQDRGGAPLGSAPLPPGYLRDLQQPGVQLLQDTSH